MFACPKISIKVLEISDGGAKVRCQTEGAGVDTYTEGRLTVDN